MPGIVLGALTKMAMTPQIGDRTVPILEMRELRPREDACPRSHPQEWRTGIQALIWGIPEAPRLPRAFWGQTSPATPTRR